MEPITQKRSVKEIEDQIYAGLNLVGREEFAATIRAIANVAADTVTRTLGPYAHTTIIDDGTFSYPTKDGWTVMSRLKFPDPLHQSMFRMIHQVSAMIVDKVGDGTSTAMDCARHFTDLLMERMESGELNEYRQADIVDAMKHVRDTLVEEIRKTAIPVVDANNPDDDYSGIYNVAYISSNGNAQLAEIMQSVYKETKNPNVLVDKNGDSRALSYEIQRGYRMDCNVLMKHYFSNTSERYYETSGVPHIFAIFNHNLTYSKHQKFVDALIQFELYRLNTQLQVNHVLVIFAPYFDDVLTATIAHSMDVLLKNKPGATPNIMLVQVPELNRKQTQNFLNDFAAIANAPIINSTKVETYLKMEHNATHGEDEQIHDSTMDMEEYKFGTMQALLDSCIATVTDAVFGKDFVTLRRINKESTRYKAAMEKAEEALADAKKEAEGATTTMMKGLMEATERITRLSGNIGVVHVGGQSELERSAMMDVVDDVFRACRAAYENGVVPGLNMGTLVPLAKLARQAHPGTEQIAIEVLMEAFKLTTLDVLRNKKLGHGGLENLNWYWTTPGSEIAGTITDTNLVENIISAISDSRIACYNIVNERCTPANEMPDVLNPADTDIEILNGIVSILSMVLTSDQYLSIARFYDRAATEKIQHQGMLQDERSKMETRMAVIGEFIPKLFPWYGAKQ